MLYPIFLAGAWVIFHLFFRVQVIGRENLKKIQSPGFILAPTHISAIDPVFIAIARFWGKKMVVFGKKELFEINPFVTWFLKQCGCMMVRGTKDEMETLEYTIAECKKGRGLLLFPEGTREKEGKLIQPKSGLFVVAAEAGTDVIPCRVLYDTPKRPHAAVLQGAGDLRGAHAGGPVRHDQPPGHQDPAGQQAGPHQRLDRSGPAVWV